MTETGALILKRIENLALSGRINQLFQDTLFCEQIIILTATSLYSVYRVCCLYSTLWVVIKAGFQEKMIIVEFQVNTQRV